MRKNVCKVCGATLPVSAAFCPGCGTPAEQPSSNNENAGYKVIAGLLAGICLLLVIACIFLTTLVLRSNFSGQQIGAAGLSAPPALTAEPTGWPTVPATKPAETPMTVTTEASATQATEPLSAEPTEELLTEATEAQTEPLKEEVDLASGSCDFHDMIISFQQLDAHNVKLTFENLGECKFEIWRVNTSDGE